MCAIRSLPRRSVWWRAVALAAAGIAISAVGARAESADAIARLSFHRGRDIYLAHRNVQKAEELISHAVARDEKYREAYLFLGGIFLDTGRLDRALALLDRALVNLPGDDELRAQRGEVLLRLGRTIDAAAERDRLVARDPVLAGWLTAQLATGPEQRLARVQALEQALAAGAAGDWKFRILTELIVAQEAAGQTAAARENHRRRMEQHPGQAQVREYSEFLVRNGIGGEEIVTLSRGLIETKSPDPADFYYLAQGAFLDGKPAEGVFAASEGMARGGPAARLEVVLARCYQALGFPQRALEHLAAAAAAGADDQLLAPYREQAGQGQDRAYHGPAISVEPRAIDVGAVADQQTRTAAFRLKNSGGEDLKLFLVWVRGTPLRIIEVLPTSEALGPGQEVEVEVRVTGAKGPYPLDAEIVLLTNDLLAPKVGVKVTGKIEARLEAIVVTEPPSPLHVGDLAAGTEVVREFLVKNAGNKELRIKEVLTSPGVTYEEFRVDRIASGGEARLVMRWLPSVQQGLATGRVAILSDDTYYPRSEVMLQATIVPPQGGSVK